MTAQEQANLNQLRAEVQQGFTEIRSLHLDMIQRIARLEATGQANQSNLQLKLMQVGIIISIAGTAWSIIHS